jgi:hypothetical protein
MDAEEVVKLWHKLSKGNANYHEELCNFYGDFRHKMHSTNTLSYVLF